MISRRTGLINASRRISIFRGLRKAEPQNRIISYTTSGGRISVVNHVECNELGAIPASTLVICAVPDFVTWAVGHLSAVSDDPHQLCQAGRYFSSEKSKI